MNNGEVNDPGGDNGELDTEYLLAEMLVSLHRRDWLSHQLHSQPLFSPFDPVAPQGSLQSDALPQPVLNVSFFFFHIPHSYSSDPQRGM